MDDITFYNNYFILDMPQIGFGSINYIETISNYYILKLTFPERISLI